MAKHLVQPESGYVETNEAKLPALQEGLTKKQIAVLADQSIQMVLEEGNVFQVAEALAAMDEFTKAVRRDERYVQFLRDELVKYHGRLVTRSGAKIEMCEAGVSYDYSNNGEWKALDEEMRLLAERKKEVEEKIRRVTPGRMGVDPETGEVIEAALKTSKSTYRITLSR